MFLKVFYGNIYILSSIILCVGGRGGSLHRDNQDFKRAIIFPVQSGLLGGNVRRGGELQQNRKIIRIIFMRCSVYIRSHSRHTDNTIMLVIVYSNYLWKVLKKDFFLIDMREILDVQIVQLKKTVNNCTCRI